MNQNFLGARLKSAREAKQVSLRSVATAIGVSPSLLSQIENGKTNPSVDTLYALVQQLGVSLDVMLDNAESQAASRDAGTIPEVDMVVQTAAGTPVIEMENGVRWERLVVLPGVDMEALRVTYQPGASSSLDGQLMQHAGFEHLVMISGELTVRFESEEVLLRGGDSMAFDSRRSHLFVNTSDQPALGIWHVLGQRAQSPDQKLDSQVLDVGVHASALDVMRTFRSQ